MVAVLAAGGKDVSQDQPPSRKVAAIGCRDAELNLHSQDAPVSSGTFCVSAQ
jgi:hypothetical protein